MKRNLIASLMAVVAIGSFGAACGDDSSSDETTDETPDDTDETPDDTDADMTPDSPGPVTYTQVEHLARPGIAEALLLSNDFLAGYNATAPSFAGVPTDTLNAVVGEAKTVLKAIFHAVCLVDGLAGFTAQNGFQPGAVACAQVGPAIFSDPDLEVIATDQAAAAQAYADKVFGQFIPDVLRIDTAVTSGYLTPCGDLTSAPLLCGGRTLSEDTIDITYDYLLAGAFVHLNDGTLPTTGVGGQLRALVSDGVNYSATSSPGSVQAADPTNPGQGHPAVSATFPYSAPPL